MGHNILLMWAVLLSHLPVIGFLYTLLLPSYFFLQYQANILCTKNVYFHICISSLRAYQISSSYFSLSNSPQNLIHLFWAGLKATYEYGLYINLLLVFQSFYTHIISLISALYPALFYLPSIFWCKYNMILTEPILSRVEMIFKQKLSTQLPQQRGIIEYTVCGLYSKATAWIFGERCKRHSFSMQE